MTVTENILHIVQLPRMQLRLTCYCISTHLKVPKSAA
jgi:hypothetical protein